MKRALLFVGLLFPLSLFAADATTVILVRHAEAAGDTSSGSTDPGLSEAGIARAKALADAVRDAGVGAAIVSDRRRTKDTAAPLAVAIVEVPVERNKVGAHVEAVAKKVRDLAGKTVVVVGHSNTIPMIVKALSGAAVTEIPHEEYDRMYVVVLEEGKPARVVVTRYGGATAVKPAT